MSRLLNYHPSATVVRLLTTNALIAYITSWVLYLSGASEDPRLLLPAWISITPVRLVCSGHIIFQALPLKILTHPILAKMSLHLALDIPVPHKSTLHQHQEGNDGFDQCFLDSRIYKYLCLATTATSNAGKRSISTAVHISGECMGVLA